MQIVFVLSMVLSVGSFDFVVVQANSSQIFICSLRYMYNFVSQVKVMGKTQFGFQVQFGREDIDLSYIEQLGEYSQTR